MPGCTVHGRGHIVNPIQAMITGQSPWGWRDGTVSAVDGLSFTVAYLGGGSIRLWHHRPAGLEVGDPVRMHEGCGLLEAPGHSWLSVRVDGGGLGAVPKPEHPELWRPEMQGAVVDLEDGKGFPA